MSPVCFIDRVCAQRRRRRRRRSGRSTEPDPARALLTKLRGALDGRCTASAPNAVPGPGSAPAWVERRPDAPGPGPGPPPSDARRARPWARSARPPRRPSPRRRAVPARAPSLRRRSCPPLRPIPPLTTGPFWSSSNANGSVVSPQPVDNRSRRRAPSRCPAWFLPVGGSTTPGTPTGLTVAGADVASAEARSRLATDVPSVAVDVFLRRLAAPASPLSSAAGFAFGFGGSDAGPRVGSLRCRDLTLRRHGRHHPRAEHHLLRPDPHRRRDHHVDRRSGRHPQVNDAEDNGKELLHRLHLWIRCSSLGITTIHLLHLEVLQEHRSTNESKIREHQNGLACASRIGVVREWIG